MKIAYFSPFSPDRSGVSDFSEELVFGLKKYMDVDIYAKTPVHNEKITYNFSVYNINNFDGSKLSEYDQRVYQVGNNIGYHKNVVDTFKKFPGILELHDLALHHYLAEDTFVVKKYDEYLKIMEYCHGEKGKNTAQLFLNSKIRAPWEYHGLKYAVNKHLIDMAKGVIVHSDLAKQYVKGVRPNVPIVSIPLHAPDIIDDYTKYKVECKVKLTIPKDTIVLGSFGYATPAKRIPQILEALGNFKKQDKRNFLYYIVGAVEHMDVKQLAHKYDIGDNVRVTGFTSLDDFKIHMGACDICFNLRYPTQGESSASLHRILGLGKPVMVSAIGSFEEYPDDIVAKIGYEGSEVADICNALTSILSSPATIDEMSAKAFAYAKENLDLDKNARKYHDFFMDLDNYRHCDNYVEMLVDRITGLGIIDQNYIQNFANEKLDIFKHLNSKEIL